MSSKKLVLGIFFIALAKSIFFSHIGFGLLDEGESLHNANRILQGDLPYRDFFAIFPPLDNYFFAFLFSIFGKSIVIPRLIMSLIFSVGLAFCFSIVAKHTSRLWAFLVCLSILFLDLNAERLFFFAPVFASLYLIFRNKQTQRSAFFVAGFLLGSVATFRADIPASFFLSLLIYIVFFSKNKAKNIFILSTGFILPISLVAFYLQLNGLVQLSFYHTVKKSLEITKLHSLPFPSFWNIFPSSFSPSAVLASFTAFFGYTILSSYIVTIYLLLKKVGKLELSDKFAFVLLVAGIFALPYIFGRSDMGHMVKGGMPALLLLAWIGKEIYLSKKHFSLFVALLFCLILFMQTAQTIWWVRFNDTKIVIGNQRLIVNGRYLPGSTLVSADTLLKASGFIKQNSQTNEPVLIVPYMAGLYFLSDRPSATNFNNVLAGFLNTSAQEQEFIEAVKIADVNVVVYDNKNGPRMKKNTLKQYNPLVHEFIMNSYAVVEETPEGWLLMKKK